MMRRRTGPVNTPTEPTRTGPRVSDARPSGRERHRFLYWRRRAVASQPCPRSGGRRVEPSHQPLEGDQGVDYATWRRRRLGPRFFELLMWPVRDML